MTKSLTETSRVCPVCHTQDKMTSHREVVRGEVVTVLRCTVCNTGAVLA